MKAKTFYADGEGDKLFSSDNHPAEVTAFLKEENRVIRELVSSKKLLVEAGCGEGENFDWAAEMGKHYIGIDVVQRYIDAAEKKAADSNCSTSYQFFCTGAEKLHEIIANSLPEGISPSDVIVLYPFNCIGNMLEVETVLKSLGEAGVDFFISSYETDISANKIRFDYYLRCGYTEVTCKIDEKGVLFSAPEGMQTYAYHAEWMLETLKKYGIQAKTVQYEPFGLGYVSK